jgi:cystathionine beta-lyase
MALLSVPIAELRTRTSLKWRTYDPDVLPLWVAEMDARMQPEVAATVAAACERSDTGYPHGTAYAEAYAAMASARWGWEVSATRQIRRAGDVMNSILAVLQATTSEGDAVVINPPVYPPFRAVVSGYGRRIVEAPLTPEGRLDLGAIEDAFSGPDAPRAYLLCSPHNPNGTVHTAAELEGVMSLASDNGVQVIVDEIHAPLVDLGTQFVPLLSVPGGERAISVTSAGKAWNLAAFKAGLIIAGAEATRVLGHLPPLAQGSSGHFADLAHTTALTDCQDWVDELRGEIAANKVLLSEQLASKVPAACFRPGAGTYLAWVDCSRLGLADPATDFRERGRVAFSPGVNFAASHDRWVRINVACSPEVLIEAVDRMAATLAG